jgi:hypothetical protein
MAPGLDVQALTSMLQKLVQQMVLPTLNDTAPALPIHPSFALPASLEDFRLTGVSASPTIVARRLIQPLRPRLCNDVPSRDIETPLKSLLPLKCCSTSRRCAVIATSVFSSPGSW